MGQGRNGALKLHAVVGGLTIPATKLGDLAFRRSYDGSPAPGAWVSRAGAIGKDDDRFLNDCVISTGHAGVVTLR